MGEKALALKPIGVIRSEHVCARQALIQPVYAEGCVGMVEVFPEFAERFLDLEGFSLDIKPFTAKFDRAEPTRNGRQDEDEVTVKNRGLRECRSEIGS